MNHSTPRRVACREPGRVNRSVLIHTIIFLHIPYLIFNSGLLTENKIYGANNNVQFHPTTPT